MLFPTKWKLILFLVVITGFSYWVLNKLTGDEGSKVNKLARHPDYYMKNFTTLTMDQDGKLKKRLNAAYMAHYPDDDTNELHKPELEIFRQGKPPLIISSDKAWVTSNNEVILLNENVHLYQNDVFGQRKFELITEDARVLVNQDYAETDKPAKLITKRQVTHSKGMRAYLQEQRIEFLSDVYTIIEPKLLP